MNLDNIDDRSEKLLNTLSDNAYANIDNIKYLSYVLKSWYDEGYQDAVYKVVAKSADSKKKDKK